MLTWQDSPIDCQAFANLAGARYNAENLDRQAGPIYYAMTHKVAYIIKELSLKGPCVLVSSSSDACVDDKLAEILPPNVKKWYANNVMTTNPRVEPIPIGFVYSCDRTAAIVQQSSQRTGKYGLLYISFTGNTPERKQLYTMFSHKPWATIRGGISHQSVAPDLFYRHIAEHHYVLSPPGAGPDCHRTWEAMALGSIPIVKRSIATSILDDMPCMQVNDWDEVTQELLEQEWESLADRFSRESLSKLSMRFWNLRIPQ